MPERATIAEVVQIGVESTPGVAVAANRKMAAFAISPAIKVTTEKYRPSGAKFPLLAALGKEWTEAGIEGNISYTDIVYLLASALSYAAPEQQGATQAYKWTFTPSQAAYDTVKTYTVEFGSTVRAARFAYGIVNEIGLNFTRDRAELSGSMLGRAIEDGITMTASPTEIDLVPVLPGSVDVYLDDTAASIGTTKLQRVLSASVSIGDRFGPLWVINSAISGYAAHVETEPKATIKVKVEANAEGMALLTALRQGSKKFLRIKSVGPVADGAYNYTLQIDACVSVSDVSEFSDEDGVYAIEWTLDATYDATFGKAISVEVINKLSTL